MADNIDQAIAAIYNAVDYIQKEASKQLGYSYASERIIIEKVRPAMVEHGIIMRVVAIPEHTLDTYTTSKGSVMNQTTLRAVIRFTHVPSGTFVDCEALGQGADTGDKSASKAMTGAYKYAIRQTFMIETGDDPDGTSSAEQERSRPRVQHIAPAEPEWYGEFVEKAREAGLKRSDIGAVLGVRVTESSWMGDVNRWLASDPEHSIDALIATALERKEEVPA